MSIRELSNKQSGPSCSDTTVTARGMQTLDRYHIRPLGLIANALSSFMPLLQMERGSILVVVV
jgi:hypothetical protein